MFQKDNKHHLRVKIKNIYIAYVFELDLYVLRMFLRMVLLASIKHTYCAQQLIK